MWRPCWAGSKHTFALPRRHLGTLPGALWDPENQARANYILLKKTQNGKWPHQQTSGCTCRTELVFAMASPECIGHPSGGEVGKSVACRDPRRQIVSPPACSELSAGAQRGRPSAVIGNAGPEHPRQLHRAVSHWCRWSARGNHALVTRGRMYIRPPPVMDR